MFRTALTSGLLAVLATTAAWAQIPVESRKIEVRGTGEVLVSADELTLPIELTTLGKDFGVVKQRNDELLKEILGLPVRQKEQQPNIDSTTVTFDFSPDERERFYGNAKGGKGNQIQGNLPPNGNDPFGEPKGEAADPEAKYPIQMTRRLTLRYRSGLSPAAESITKLTALDAVRKTREIRLSPLQPGVTNLALHQSKARELAVSKALAKGLELAKASGLRLNGAETIVEENNSHHAWSSPAMRPPAFDPFGRNDPAGPADERASPTIFVALQPGNAPAELPPAQIVVSVTVKVIYDASLPK